MITRNLEMKLLFTIPTEWKSHLDCDWNIKGKVLRNFLSAAKKQRIFSPNFMDESMCIAITPKVKRTETKI